MFPKNIGQTGTCRIKWAQNKIITVHVCFWAMDFDIEWVWTSTLTSTLNEPGCTHKVVNLAAAGFYRLIRLISRLTGRTYGENIFISTLTQTAELGLIKLSENIHFLPETKNGKIHPKRNLRHNYKLLSKGTFTEQRKLGLNFNYRSQNSYFYGC